MIYASVIIVLKNGRYHAISWKDFGSSKQSVENKIKKEYGKKAFASFLSFDLEETRKWENSMLIKNESIDPIVKERAVKEKAKQEAAHLAKLANKKPKVNKGIKVQSYGQWLAQKHVPAVKKKK
jgi:hypothetical protein